MGYSGKYKVINRKKYLGDAKKIVWRSLWERKVCRYLDLNSSVLKWSSEEIVIPYISSIDGKRHRYFVDFYAEVITKSGKIKKYLIEVKPKESCSAPKIKKRITKRYLRAIQTWGINTSKWKAAQALCEKNGWEFKILTEDEIFGKKPK